MTQRRLPHAALACLVPLGTLVSGAAEAQTSFIAPDGHNRFPGVTIFCPSGTGVTPCNFGGGGGGGGSVSLTLGGTAVSISNRLPVSDTALDALIAGGALGIAGTVSVGSLPPLAAGGNAIGSVSVSNLPATQPVSAATLPLPSGAATAAAQTAPLAPIAPGAATATNAVMIGCVANAALPSFTAGQQGGLPCDLSGRPTVVTVPSANNVPSYLQAVSSGGAGVYRAINAAASAMAANVKTNTGMVYGYEACNAGTASAFLRLFALGVVPTVGTSVPSVSKLLPAGVCETTNVPVGLVFPGGIGLDVTSGSLADSDTAVIATASQVSVEIYYK